MFIQHYDNKRNRLQDRDVLESHIKEELNGNDTFEFRDTSCGIYNKYDYIVFEYKGEYYEYVVQKVIENAKEGSRVYCENSIVELKNVIIESSTEDLERTVPDYIFAQMLKGTNWHIGKNFYLSAYSQKFDRYMTLYDIIRRIIEINGFELLTKIELQNGKLVRFVTISERIGEDKGVRLEYRGKLKKLNRIYEDKEVFTSILPIGSVVEHEKDGKPIDPEEKRKQEEAKRKQENDARENKKKGTQSLVVNCTSLNVRPDPSVKNKPLRVLHNHDKIEAVEEKKVGSYAWVRLSTGGWVRKSYTQSASSSNYAKDEKAADRKKEEAERLRLEASKKPLTLTYSTGSMYLENKEATQKYGIEVDGRMLPRIGILKLNITNETELRRKAEDSLEFYSRPRVVYEVDVYEYKLDNMRLGDGAIIIDDELGVSLKARVIERNINPDSDVCKIKIGNVSNIESVLTKATKNALTATENAMEAELSKERVNTTKTLMNGGTFTSYGSEPPEYAREGDVWYRYNPDGTIDILVWNGSDWVMKMWGTFEKELKAQVDATEKRADEFHKQAEDHQKEIDEAIKKAGFSIDGHTKTLQEMQTKLVDLTSKTSPDAIKNIIKKENYATEDSVHNAISKIDVNKDIKTYLETHEVMKPDTFKRYIGEISIDENGNTVAKKISQIEQNQNGISSTVADNKKNIESRVTQLANVVDSKISSSEFESRFSQSEKGLYLKAEEAAKKYAESAAKEIVNVEKDLSDYRPSDFAENYPNKIVRFSESTNKEDIKNAIAKLADRETASYLEDVIGLNEVTVLSGEEWKFDDSEHPNIIPSKVIQRFKLDKYDHEIDITRESYSMYKWGEWKLSAKNLMSGINVEAGGVEIFSDKNKLVVSPDTTYIKDATITSTMIKEGSIGTAHIGVIWADSSNIRNITAANLTANRAAFIEALFSGNDSMLKITGDSIEMTPYKTRNGFGVKYDSHSINFNYDGYRHSTLRIYEDGNGNIAGTMLASTWSNQSIALGYPDPNNWNEKPDKREHFSLGLEIATDNPGVKHWDYEVKCNLDLNMRGHKITAQSDIRLKNDIKDWDVHALDEIKKIEFIRFHWKDRHDKDRPTDTKTEQYGISAQSTPFLSVEGGDGYLSIDQTKLLYTTTKGVQELEERVSRLEKENEELKKRLEALEKRLS